MFEQRAQEQAQLEKFRQQEQRTQQTWAKERAKASQQTSVQQLSLIEIQQQQARQLLEEEERKKKMQKQQAAQQQHQQQLLSMNTPAAWSSVVNTNQASGGDGAVSGAAWKVPSGTQASGGFWDAPAATQPQKTSQKAAKKNKKNSSVDK